MSTVKSIRLRASVAAARNLALPIFYCLTASPAAHAGYEEDVAPLMRDKCNSCHASQAPMLGSYDQVKGAIAAIITTISVDPAGPEKDKLMPKNGPKLAQADIDKIKTWQSAGMPEKNSDTTATGNTGPASTDTATQPPADPAADPATAGPATSTDTGAQPGTDVASPGTDNGQPTPLIVDLEGKGQFAFATKPVFFDIRGTGQRLLSWPSPSSAFLVLDLDNDNQITSGRELFGDGTMIGDSGRRATNGFEALAQYDANHDGMIDQADPVFRDLQLWHDRNSNGNTDSGELSSVAGSGIKSFSLVYESHAQALPGGEEIPLLTAWYVDTDSSGTPRNKVLADIFLTDFSQKTSRAKKSR